MPVRRLCFLLAAPIATSLLGILVLQRHGTTSPRLILMVGALAFSVIVATMLAANGRRLQGRSAPFLACGALALLAATAFGEGLLGVHRWITLGPFTLQASPIACPILLATAIMLLSRGREAWAAIIIAAAQAIHSFQPDAGQSTALAAGALTGLALWPAPILVRAAGLGAIALSIVPAWIRPDPLPPVLEVEGIVQLAQNLGRPVQMLAIALVSLLPTSLVIAALRIQVVPSGTPERRPDGAVARATCAALAAYVAGIVLAPMIGNFPVPMLGFGVSPVLGVGICVGISAAFGDDCKG